MGVSAVGERMTVATVRYALATVVVFFTLFYFFYGPPLTAKFSDAANERCNELTGNTFRSYRLEWRTTTYHGINPPHWVCYDLTDVERDPINLGWWVDL